MPGLGLGGGSGSSPVNDITRSVPLSTGGIYTLTSSSLTAPITWSKLSGNANLTVVSGVVTAAVALTAGASQSIIVRGVSGNDAIEFQVTVTGAVTAPLQVGTVTPTPGDTQVALAWSAPGNGGSAITDYLVEYKLSSSGTWLTFAHTASPTAARTVTGLTNASPYDFRVSAINAVGTGPASSTVSATPSASVAAATSTFTATATATANYDNNVFQRDTLTGGGFGKGQGSVTVPISSATAGTVNAQCRSVADGTTILQAPWAAATITNGATSVNITGIDAREERFYLDLFDSAGVKTSTRPIMMGDVEVGCGQSLEGAMLGSASSDFAATGVTQDPYCYIIAFTDTVTAPVASLTWAQVGTTPYKGGGYAQKLRLRRLEKGVAQGLISGGIGGTSLDLWQYNGTNGTKLGQLFAACGSNGGKAAYVHLYQGHENAKNGVSATQRQADVEFFFFGAGGLSSQNSYASPFYTVGDIPSLHATPAQPTLYGFMTDVNAVRVGDMAVANAHSSNMRYIYGSNLLANSDGIHPATLPTGTPILGTNSWRAERSAAIGPRIASISRTSATTFLITWTLDASASTIVLTGNSYARFAVMDVGSVQAYWAPSNHVKNTATTSTLTVPGLGDGNIVDVWLGGSYYGDFGGGTGVDNWSDMISDDYTGDGVSWGRPFVIDTTPWTVPAYMGGVTVNHPPGYPFTSLSKSDMVETSTAYSAEIRSGFGTVLTGGYGTAADRQGFFPATTSGFYLAPAAAPSSNSSLWGGTSHSGLVHRTGSTGITMGNPFGSAPGTGLVTISSNLYWIITVVDQNGARLYAQNITAGGALTLISSSAVAPTKPYSIVGSLAMAAASPNIFSTSTGAAIFGVGYWQGGLVTGSGGGMVGYGPFASLTAPTTQLTGTEPGLIDYFPCNGDLKSIVRYA